jgi:signal peptidase I
MEPVFAVAAAVFLKIFIAEAFIISSNSMAPTILGPHWEAPCPSCGSPCFATPEPGHRGPVLMICESDRRSYRVANPSDAVYSGDRLLVNKLATPARWDVIAFRHPEAPERIHCSRLVGLPGETVKIHDGVVWIDGRKQRPPKGCKGIEYLDDVEGWPDKIWGTDATPAKLGVDEYFVLGDFSARARDSRLWQHGAPGHPPYAVPGSNIVGVAEFIYWPLSRCAWLR